MKLKFKKQQYQTNAVDSVVDCFAGQPSGSLFKYKIDPGRVEAGVIVAPRWAAAICASCMLMRFSSWPHWIGKG